MLDAAYHALWYEWNAYSDERKWMNDIDDLGYVLTAWNDKKEWRKQNVIEM